MSVLVTGGAGFIGSHLVGALLKKNCLVSCIDDFNDYYDPRVKRRNISEFLKNKNFSLFEGDIRDTGFVENIFKNNTFTVVIHLAARAGVRSSISHPKLYAEVNINGLINILEQVKKDKNTKFIFASSSSVYGNNKKVPFLETDNVDFPISPYAATKKAGELICHSYHYLYGMRMACLRFFTVYGPRQRPEMAIYLFIRSILHGKPIEMYGDGSTSRDYTYIDDIISGILSVMEKKILYEIVNLGNSYPVKLIELIGIIEKCSGKKAVIKKLPMQSGDVERTWADITRAKELLGYNPKVSIEEGIRRTIEWHVGQISHFLA